MLRNCFNSSITRHFSHHATRSTSKTSTPQKDGLNLLLYTLERFSSSSTFQADSFAPFIHKKLSWRVDKASSPHRIYEAVSNFLIHKHYPLEAVSVVKRMQKEGYVPSRLLQAQMALVALAHPVGLENHLLEKLTAYFTSKDCTEKEFLLLFDTMNKYSIKSDIIASFVSSFIDNREPGYQPDPRLLGYIVQASIKAGELDTAFQTAKSIPVSPEAVREARKAHIAILAAIRDTNTRESDAVNTVLSSMKEKGLQPNIAVMNVLLSREVRLNRRSAALRIYRLLQEMARTDPRVKPDSYTFGTMFALYRSIKPRAMRQHHGSDDTKNAYPPRALFRDFMQSCTRVDTTGKKPQTSDVQKSTLQPNSILLTAALRVFMRHRDYAGAFVSLSSFTYLSVPLDSRVWYSVLKLLIRRVWTDLSAPRSASTVGWGYAFLGLRDGWRDSHGSNILDERVVNGILDTIARPSFLLLDPLYVPGRPPMKESEKKYQIPTMEMMEEVVPTKEAREFVYEIHPLKRILRRALFAQILEQGRMSEAEAVKEVSNQIAAAKKEMLGS